MEALSLTMSTILTNSSWQHGDFAPTSLRAEFAYAAAQRLPERRHVPVSKANAFRNLDTARENCNSHRRPFTKNRELALKVSPCQPSERVCEGHPADRMSVAGMTSRVYPLEWS